MSRLEKVIETASQRLISDTAMGAFLLVEVALPVDEGTTAADLVRDLEMVQLAFESQEGVFSAMVTRA